MVFIYIFFLTWANNLPRPQFPYRKTGIFIFFNFFLKILFIIYLTERETAREGTQTGGVGEGEAVFPRSREPYVRLNVGLDPRTPRS